MNSRFFTRKSFLLVSILFLSVRLFAQDGFNKRYTYGTQSSVFYNLIPVEDKIIVTGVGADSQQIILIHLMDTLGNILQSHTIRDTAGVSYTMNLNYDIVRSQNDKLVFVGENGSQKSFIAELDLTGNLTEIYHQIDSSVLVVFQNQIDFIGDDYVVGGHKQKTDYTHVFFVKRISKNGGVQWEKKYGINGVNNILRGMTQIQENQFIVSGLHGNPQGTQLPNWWAQSWIFAIDSLGNKLWEFEGPVNDEIAAIGTQQTVDGNWIYGTGDFQLIGNNEWGSQTKIVCRDPQWNLLWQTNISPTVYSTNRIRDIVPAHDGNYIVIGEWTTPQTPGEANYGGGCIVKINPEGDTLWTRLFTGFPTQPKGTANYMGGVAVLPSGSIITAGYSRRFYPTSVASQGWVIKISPDGCVVDTLCITTPTIEPARASTSPVSVFPNPAQTQVTFALPTGSDPARVRLVVWDAFGREVWSFAGWLGPDGLPWTPQNLPAGVYFWKIDGEVRQSGKLVWGE